MTTRLAIYLYYRDKNIYRQIRINDNIAFNRFFYNYEQHLGAAFFCYLLFFDDETVFLCLQ